MPSRARLFLFLFLCAALRPASDVFAADVYCSDLTAVSATSGWSTVQKDKCINTNPIMLGGKLYTKGLGTHSPSEIVYNLNGKYATFTVDAGIDDGTKGKGSSEFLVYGDDSLLFKSPVIRGQMAPAKINVSVLGKNKLKLVVTIGPDTYDMDDADWGGAMLTEKTATSIAPLAPVAGARYPAFPWQDGMDIRGAQVRPPRGGAMPHVLLFRAAPSR
jgi:hypothetical protein